jgi:alpha-L-rhamnosidase
MPAKPLLLSRYSYALFTVVCLCSSSALYGQMAVSELKCERATNPIGVESKQPRLSWMLQDSRFGARQTAYRIQVAKQTVGPLSIGRSLDDKFDSQEMVWDSGKVVSDQSIHVKYEGLPLKSRERCWWRVQVWDADGSMSPWSAVACWEMGLLCPEDWRAKWIEAPVEMLTGNLEPSGNGESIKSPQDISPLLRTSFEVNGSVVQARAYVCGLGYHELYLNDQKIGLRVLEPAQTDYFERAFYTIYDVTNQLQDGPNAIGLWLGNGWFNQTKVYGHWAYGRPCAIVQLEITYADGHVQSVYSDKSWQAAVSPVVANNVHLGETYDARLEIAGWASPRFDSQDWSYVLERSSPTNLLQSQLMPAIERVAQITPQRVNEPPPGEYIFDMGQNFAGWVKLSIRGKAGEVVDLRFAEALTPEGRLDQRSTGIYQADRYICKGEGLEVWEPRFT